MAAAAHQSFRLTWADLAGNLDEGSEISNRTLFKLAFNEYKISNELIKILLGGGDKKSNFIKLSIPNDFNCKTIVIKFDF